MTHYWNPLQWAELSFSSVILSLWLNWVGPWSSSSEILNWSTVFHGICPVLKPSFSWNCKQQLLIVIVCQTEGWLLHPWVVESLCFSVSEWLWYDVVMKPWLLIAVILVSGSNALMFGFCGFSLEEAKKRIYACSTTTYQGFQAVMTEAESEQFRGKWLVWKWEF